ncbi:MAG TPA: DUF929 family protein [Thermoplasmata archaeon]|nr:DUF929 family protein [Thermoplasmata archaeon]
MVDWDRVEELRSKGWDWDRIAADPKVAFHPDASVSEEGRALRALYHRRKSRQDRRGGEEPAKVSKQDRELKERQWTLARVGYLATPTLAVWAALAYVAPSPVGLVLPAIPWLLLGLAVAAFVLLFGLWRSSGARWSKLFRSTVVYGIVLGLVVAGVIGIAGTVLFGCPYLPPSLGNQPAPGWGSVSTSAWHDNGLPVFYFYGATWCPYCSASSWAMWKALTEFEASFSGTTSGIPGTSFQYSSDDPAGPYTPEVVLAVASVNSPALSFQVSEYFWTPTSGTEGTFPGTSNCYQQAYVTAYSGSSIPFVVLNGQYVHAGSSLVSPGDLSPWASSGVQTVATSVLTESGSPWTTVSSLQTQAGWICAYILKANGFSTVASFLAANPGLNQPSKYQWTSAMTNVVNSDLAQL